eukprot:186641_1
MSLIRSDWCVDIFESMPRSDWCVGLYALMVISWVTITCRTTTRILRFQLETAHRMGMIKYVGSCNEADQAMQMGSGHAKLMGRGRTENDSIHKRLWNSKWCEDRSGSTE